LRVPDSSIIGGLLALPLGLPVIVLDLGVAFNSRFGDWSALALVIPFLFYFGLAAALAIVRRPRTARGMAIGGSVVSVLIVAFILLLAFVLSALAE
jgi:hypothetical protein